MTNRIIDLIKVDSFNYSCEVTPDLNYSVLEGSNLLPIFYSVTWHAKSHRCIDLDIGPLKVAYKLRESGKNVLLHLSCDLLKSYYLNQLLQRLQEKYICNLFIVLGESYDPVSSDYVSCQELIKYIREKTGDYFCIGVTGYPGCEGRMSILKDKVISGADFIITQAVFEKRDFVNFVETCKEMEIHVPIFPGVFAFETMEELNRFTNICKVKITSSLSTVANQQILDFSGYDFIIKLINDIIESEGDVKNFHFFTLNKFEKISNIVKNFD